MHRSVIQSVPVVACPSCAWAKGGLSVADAPLLIRAHLRQHLVEHLTGAHGVVRAEAEKIATQILEPQPSPEPLEPSEKLQSA